MTNKNIPLARHTVVGPGGSGDEAKITLEFRKEFPGIGGTIITSEGTATALREEHSCTPKMGHRMFLKHMIFKKLEDYFLRKELYQVSHIPRPLGSVSKIGGQCYEAYIYEWVFGSEGFPWRRFEPDTGNVPVMLSEWNIFVSSFNAAGIDLGSDCTDPQDETSKNIIHERYQHMDMWADEGLNFLWKRIDFGPRSMRIDQEKLLWFLEKEAEEIKRELRVKRYIMIRLAYDYLTKGKDAMDRLDIGRLIELIGEYRESSLRHLISRGVGQDKSTVVFTDEGSESLM